MSVALRVVLGELETLLASAGVVTPEVDAQLLVRSVTGLSRAELLTAANLELGAEQVGVLRGMGERRAEREPLQLILGSVGFRYLEVVVRPGVFVPRPETEVLAGEAVARVPVGGVVVEPCTGTGAIACAVASEAHPGTVVATDLSRAAADLARYNATRCGVGVTVLRGDLLAPVDPGLRGRVDVLVSNPPYVAESELAGLEPEVVEWDPRSALVAGPSGHEVSDRLIAAAGEWLTPGGWLLLEVDERRAAATAARAAAAGLTESGTVADLAGRDRVVVARRPRPHVGKR
ncbi:MAG: peptide chain release factor N(5)-glutamine methyltransferase [Egibacteraceae bacterium]